MLGNEAILILDFGAQYSQLIARRVRDLNVFCEIKSYQISADEIAKKGYKGIIFSGGPNSVYAEKALRCVSSSRFLVLSPNQVPNPDAQGHDRGSDKERHQKMKQNIP